MMIIGIFYLFNTNRFNGLSRTLSRCERLSFISVVVTLLLFSLSFVRAFVMGGSV